MKDWERLVEELKMLPHPEGGYYKETYRSAELTAVKWSDKDRNLSTSILYLITGDNFSAFHRIQQDELWYYQGGDGIVIHEINPAGEHTSHQLHLDPNIGRPQLLIPAGSWFASGVLPGGDWGLAGCMVSPGFDFADFELAKRVELSEEYPQHGEIIRKFTRDEQ